MLPEMKTQARSGSFVVGFIFFQRVA